MDGTTDVATMEQESLFLRTVSNGHISSQFLKIVEPPNTTGDGLLLVIKDALEEISRVTSLLKFTGFGCDGAANMLGKFDQ